MISKELILEGAKFRKCVYLDIYDDDIEIRPLKESEIAKIFKQVEQAGFNTSDPKLSDNYMLQVEACRFGIVDPALHALVNPAATEGSEEYGKEVFESMVGNALAEIGREIIAISTSGSEELANFFKQAKGKNLSSSLTQAIVSPAP